MSEKVDMEILFEEAIGECMTAKGRAFLTASKHLFLQAMFEDAADPTSRLATCSKGWASVALTAEAQSVQATVRELAERASGKAAQDKLAKKLKLRAVK